MIMPLAQIDQSITMYFNTQQILKNTAEVLQVPPSNLRTEEEVQAIIQKQEQEKLKMLRRIKIRIIVCLIKTLLWALGQLNTEEVKAEMGKRL